MYSVLSLFPGLLTFSPFAPTVIRIAVSLVMLALSAKAFKAETTYTTSKIIALIEIASATALFIGLYTQAAAILLFISTVSRAFGKGVGIPPAEKYLAIVMASVFLSLALTGPGLVAVDLPL